MPEDWTDETVADFLDEDTPDNHDPDDASQEEGE